MENETSNNHETANGIKSDVIGSAYVNGKWRNIIRLDESNIATGAVRVVYKDEIGRWVGCNVLPERVVKHCR